MEIYWANVGKLIAHVEKKKNRFYNGGVLFSTLFLAFVAFVSVYAFLLLIETRNKIPASFGDIGGILYGRAMRMLVLFAIATSQVKKKKKNGLKP
jgi:amino acid permease